MAEARAPIDLTAQTGFRATAYLCLFLLYLPILILIIFSQNAGD